ncbi:aspartate aminotransferase family protein [Candidatus Woesearchaeota archaeon]|jgi:L-2,4-diaminobutyrate decarboxylase|nr:aspartate aminotransferase family protein [Candidatus Woesearchaeota archaeon]
MTSNNLFFNGQIGEPEEFIEIFKTLFSSRSIRDSAPSRVASETDIAQLVNEFETKPQHRASNDDFSFQNFMTEFAQIYEKAGLSFNPHSYFAHMLSDPTKIGVVANLIGALMTGNQVCREVSPIENHLEQRVGQYVKNMLGYDQKEAISFITAGGTDANILALLTGRNVSYLEKEGVNLKKIGFPEMFSPHSDVYEKANLRIPKLIVPASFHYSWDKTANAIGIGENHLVKIRSTSEFRMDLDELQVQLDSLDRTKEKPMGVVFVLGSTEIGAVDDIAKGMELVRKYEKETGERIWLHLDAAYGGPSVLTKKYAHLKKVVKEFDSVTFDPHKLFWVPYNAGSITFKNRDDLQTVSTDASYINNDLSNIEEFKKNLETHLGGVKLIGSQSTAGVISTYLTCVAFGLAGIGETIETTFENANYFASQLQSVRLSEGRIEVMNPEPDLNLVNFRFVPEKFKHVSKKDYFGGDVSSDNSDEIKSLNVQIEKYFSESDSGFIVSSAGLATNGEKDTQIYAIRTCLMHPDTTRQDIDRFVGELCTYIESDLIRGDC